MKTLRTAAAVLATLFIASAALHAQTPPPHKGKGAPPPHAKQGKGWSRFAATYDVNNDGKVTKEEFLAKKPAFDRADTNKDGGVTADEIKALPAAQKRGKTGQGFEKRFDANHDGKVTADEFDAKRTKGFEKMDTNHDGAVTSDEFAAGAKKAQNKKKSSKPAEAEESETEDLGE